MKRLAVFCLAIVATCSFLLPTANAEDSDLEIHGFISQGYLSTSDNVYLVRDSDDGSLQFSEAAVNFSKEINDNLRGGLQLLSRDFGEVGNNDIKLDWGFLDYSKHDYFGIRLGKVKNEMGLYNSSRDVDLLRSCVLLPQSVYNESLRDLYGAVQGGGFYGVFDVWGGVTYETSIGVMDLEDENTYFAEGLNTIAAAQGTTVDKSTIDADGKILYSGSLRWTPPVDGLRLGISCAAGEMDLSGTITGTPASLSLEMETKYALFYSAEYIKNGFTLAAEYLHNKVETRMATSGAVLSTRRAQGYYALCSYRVNDLFEFGTYYSVYYPDKSDKDGNRFTALGLNDFRAWQKDLTVFTRFDINDNWLVKAEVHFIDGTASVIQSYTTNEEKDWEMFAIKTTYSF